MNSKEENSDDFLSEFRPKIRPPLEKFYINLVLKALGIVLARLKQTSGEKNVCALLKLANIYNVYVVGATLSSRPKRWNNIFPKTILQ
jgi:hypothetical protein